VSEAASDAAASQVADMGSHQDTWIPGAGAGSVQEWGPDMGGTKDKNPYTHPTERTVFPTRTIGQTIADANRYIQGKGNRTINPYINVNQNKRDTQSNWGKFLTKMRGWNEEDDRPNTQAEYEQARYNRQTGNRIDRLRKTRDVGKYANDPAGWEASELSGRLAGFEKGLYGPNYTDYSRTALKARDAFTPGITGSDAASKALSGEGDWRKRWQHTYGKKPIIQDALTGANEITERDDLDDIEGALAFTRDSPKDKRLRTLHNQVTEGLFMNDADKKEYQDLLKEDREQTTEPKTYFSAQGGLIGSVGGTSRQKYQQGNMVEGEIEGAEMEGAMMQSKEVIKELYDALIAQGLSPQEAIEKIKQMLAASGAERPQSPIMGEEFGRAPAAFGGIMDTATGRRRYLFGSVGRTLKKAGKKLKKLASSKVGQIALMYVAGTYLGGMEGMGGGGYGNWFGKGALGPQGAWTKFKTQLLNPLGESGIANLARPKGWSMFQKAPPIDTATMKGLELEKAAANANKIANLEKLGSVPLDKMTAFEKYNWENAVNALKPVKESFIDKIPGGALTAVALPSIYAHEYTAKQPPEELGGEVTGEYDADLQKWKDYYAGLDSDYSVNPDRLKSAQGGRIGAQEGGLMNLGGMEKDYRNDGGFVPLGGEEKADDVPARLSRNEFVFTADAVRNAGGGDIDRGAEVMENVMKNLEAGGKVSEESQGEGAQGMFETSERLSEVV
jgi:hypothetical protein